MSWLAELCIGPCGKRFGAGTWELEDNEGLLWEMVQFDIHPAVCTAWGAQEVGTKPLLGALLEMG